MNPTPTARSGLPTPLRTRPVTLTMASSDGVLLTVDEAAEKLRVGRSKLYELLATGQIASIHVGRLRRIEPQALTDYIHTQRTT